MALAFHHTHFVHYKVVCICSLEPYGDLFQIQVYSSDTKKWKIFIKSFSVQAPAFRSLVYWNGAVYWTPGSQNNLFYFKLDAEELQMLPLPVEMMTNKSRIMYFGESKGHLHLIFHTEGEEYLLHAYKMLTDHSGWFVKYRLQFDMLLRGCPCLFFHYEHVGVFGTVEHRYSSSFQVVDVVRGKEEEDSFLVLLTREKMIRYNVHDKSFKEFYSCNNGSLHPSRCHQYIETLSAF
ncbi:F-box protein At5g07610-like [Bidens hawaiensis]|uniref:F-box protein At5g07610-like n=1 Tax=Bidens hawaiensis TaxID=980011 RepID=UPI00404B8088